MSELTTCPLKLGNRRSEDIERRAEAAHTPEPWEQGRTYGPHAVPGKCTYTISARGTTTSARGTRVSSDLGRTNAVRIVACVNYCEGLPQPYLEARAYKKDPANPLLGIPSADRLTALERAAEATPVTVANYLCSRFEVSRVPTGKPTRRVYTRHEVAEAVRTALAALDSQRRTNQEDGS